MRKLTIWAYYFSTSHASGVELTHGLSIGNLLSSKLSSEVESSELEQSMSSISLESN